MSFLLSTFPWPTFFLTPPVIYISTALYLSLSAFHVGVHDTPFPQCLCVVWEFTGGRNHILLILLSSCLSQRGRLKMATHSFPFKKWSVFLLTMNQGWPCHLLWLTECGWWNCPEWPCKVQVPSWRNHVEREREMPGQSPALPAIPSEVSDIWVKPSLISSPSWIPRWMDSAKPNPDCRTMSK